MLRHRLIAATWIAAPFLMAQAARFDAGLELYRHGHPREALREFEASEKIGELKPLRRFYQGVCLAKLGDLPEASARLLDYVSAQPSDPHGWYWLSRTQYLTKRFEEARESIDRAIRLDANASEYHRTLGEIEFQLHRYDAAHRAWIDAGKLNASDPQTTYYLGRLFFEADFPDEAAAWLRETLRLAPDHFNAMTYLGLCAQQLGDNVTASRLFTEAIRQSRVQKTPFAWAFLSYAKLLRQLGDDRQALSILEESEKTCPEPHALAILGQLLAAARQFARAEAVLRRAVEIDPGVSEAHYRLSLLLRSQGRPEEAQREMKAFQEAKNAEERDRVRISAIRK